jgi:hypothetical protein
MQPCPICANQLRPILVDGHRATCCSNKFCAFNFQDQKCPQCGSPVVEATGKALNEYDVKCAKGHEWSFCD